MLSVRRHTRMKRIVRFFVLLVALAAAACIVLIVAANLKPRSNKIPNWRLNLEQIKLAKQEWAGDRVGTTNDTPTFEDLRTYFPVLPELPGGFSLDSLSGREGRRRSF
jgi:hypothetical protein